MDLAQEINQRKTYRIQVKEEQKIKDISIL
jgi:hypothetical protein